MKKVITRIKAVYGGWNRETTLEQMRNDWDSLFADESVAAETENFQVESLACRWVNNVSAVDSNNVVLYLHGGGFRLGSIDSHQGLMARISAASGCKVVGVDYRLIPEHRFPAALEDCFQVYQWLLDQGYQASNIAIAGDSAGGNLVGALLNLIKQRGVAKPGCAVFLSAWLDMETKSDTYQTREPFDPIHSHKMIQSLAKSYLRDEKDYADTLASPILADLSDLPPMLLQAGDHEVGLGDSNDYAEKAKEAGVDVELEVYDEMIHAFHLFAADLPEAIKAIDSIGRFLNRKLG